MFFEVMFHFYVSCIVRYDPALEHLAPPILKSASHTHRNWYKRFSGAGGSEDTALDLKSGTPNSDQLKGIGSSTSIRGEMMSSAVANSLLNMAFMPRISQIAVARLQMSAEYDSGAGSSNQASEGCIANDVWQSFP
ncbi:hypothetical protein ACO22_03638 [Paracoccidioides brasiliensis]|uniref:Uncharacterized protein n=1 Tax=Paracoccidioides brasiliensis TaxID=121759 RepID=A0A1D2JFC3_PARBR|nr:hypothetical protein ACO22_03638 [Paracoccidioides brasiliensis]